MEDNAITWVANNPYCIAAIALVGLGGLIMLVVDCWQKWR